MSREAMKLALEALEDGQSDDPYPYSLESKAITALREALAEQPAQLPFGVGGGLVAIKTLLSRDPCVHANTAIQMIDAILAEQPAQQQEPVVRCMEHGECFGGECIYTSPPAQRTWVGLTDEEWQDLSDRYGLIIWGPFKREIEAKLREKNT